MKVEQIQKTLCNLEVFLIIWSPLIFNKVLWIWGSSGISQFPKTETSRPRTLRERDNESEINVRFFFFLLSFSLLSFACFLIQGFLFFPHCHWKWRCPSLDTERATESSWCTPKQAAARKWFSSHRHWIFHGLHGGSSMTVGNMEATGWTLSPRLHHQLTGVEQLWDDNTATPTGRGRVLWTLSAPPCSIIELDTEELIKNTAVLCGQP